MSLVYRGWEAQNYEMQSCKRPADLNMPNPTRTREEGGGGGLLDSPYNFAILEYQDSNALVTCSEHVDIKWHLLITPLEFERQTSSAACFDQ